MIVFVEREKEKSLIEYPRERNKIRTVEIINRRVTK